MILHELISYDVLRLIWWLLLGVLLVGFAVTDGFDLGAMGLLRATAKTDVERRTAINSVGPVWEGNQVWLILGGGAIFAAWPQLYAVSFSGFYLAMFAVLVPLILRPVAFKFRSKHEDAAWRNRWDWVLCITGLVPALLFGVAVGNVILGVPFRLGDDMRIYYDGSFFGLLTPFALLCGLVSLSMLLMHGAAWLMFKTDGEVASRAARYGTWFAVLTTVLFAAAGLWLATGINGYVITSEINPCRSLQPLEQDRSRGCRGMDGQLQVLSLALAGARYRPAHAADRGHRLAQPSRVAGAAGKRPGDCRNHPDRGRCHVPHDPAFQH